MRDRWRYYKTCFRGGVGTAAFVIGLVTIIFGGSVLAGAAWIIHAPRPLLIAGLLSALVLAIVLEGAFRRDREPEHRAELAERLHKQMTSQIQPGLAPGNTVTQSATIGHAGEISLGITQSAIAPGNVIQELPPGEDQSRRGSPQVPPDSQ